MKYSVTILLVLLVMVPALFSNGHQDPAYLQIQSAENPIVVDGVLDETDWQRRFDYLVFRNNFEPSDVEYTTTAGFQVHGNYADTTTTIVKILHHGMDLYISMQSDDQSVGKFGSSWEGDGLFMKIKDANGMDVEYKLFFNLSGTNPDIAYEEPGLYPNSGSGAAWKHANTIVNDTTAADSGYTAELVIHLDQLGYTANDHEVPVLFNIFDPDGYVDNMDPWGTIGSYYKEWWGSEWGPDMRILRLADPVTKVAIKTTDTITLDGQLNEAFWAGADQVVVSKGNVMSTGGYYMQWGDTLNEYTDQSEAVIKFVHNGTDLYIGVESNDSSVCSWSPGWEGDGLFLWMTYKDVIPGPADRLEIKNMYFGTTVGSGSVFELNSNVPTGGAEGASFEPAGTVTHTGSNGMDAGYSLEVVVHTDLFGYAEGDTVKLSTVIWDLDFSAADEFDMHIADYAPNWWGTQWADPNFEKYFMYRNVVLSSQTVGIEDEPVSGIISDYNLEQNYPNPFNPTTTIRYSLPTATDVTVEIFDLLGGKVTTLLSKNQQAGEHSVQWNGLNSHGNMVANGIYLYQLNTPEFSQTRKMILMK